MRILFVVNNPAFFLQQHLPVAEGARRKGYEVHIAAPDGADVQTIMSRGYSFHRIPIARGTLNLYEELVTVLSLTKLYRRVQPDLVHHLTHKPVLYGTLAARIAGVPGVLNANTGLGYLFIDNSWRTRLVRSLFQHVGRVVLSHWNQIDLFLNADDQFEFVTRGLTTWDRSAVVQGPGVDPSEFPFVEPDQTGVPVVVLPARLLIHKGVREFVEAARLLRGRGIDARFVLVGDPDPGNRASLEQHEIQSWRDEGVVELWGYRTDMAAVFAQCAICVLPSYREGLGRVLIEAASTGRPLVATDVPGCRDAVQDGFNGLLVPAGNVEALARAVERLLDNHQLRQRLGDAGRALVLDRFAVRKIVDRTLRYHEVLLDVRAEQMQRINDPARERASEAELI